jgi:two-component system, OmpR family, alkaline phosphatase synthesis response regulator PhoP
VSTDIQARSALVVEDDTAIRELVCLHLGLEGYKCTEAATGPEGLRLAERETFDAIVLDVMLPGLDGITLCRAIRKPGVASEQAAILMLTARREESDKVLGLESGADDYLTKPFGVRELVARIRALQRRPRLVAPAAPGAARERHIVVKGLHLDPARRKVTVDEAEVELTRQEFNLLHLLASHPGIVFTREALVARAWPDDTSVTTRSVDTIVKRLRRKIEPQPDEPRYVITVWGSGYKFSDV